MDLHVLWKFWVHQVRSMSYAVICQVMFSWSKTEDCAFCHTLVSVLIVTHEKKDCICMRSNYIICVAKSAISVFLPLHRRGGYETDLTRDDLHTKSEICKMCVSGLVTFWKFQLPQKDYLALVWHIFTMRRFMYLRICLTCVIYFRQLLNDLTNKSIHGSLRSRPL